MGVVKRQSAKFSVVAYAGVILGAINVLLIYPYALAEGEIGLIRGINDLAGLLVPFVYMGANALAIRFFPEFQDTGSGHRGFLGFLLLICLIGFGIFLSLFPVIEDQLLRLTNAEDTRLLRRYLPYAIPLVFFMAVSQILTAYCSNFQRIAFPGMLQQLIKIILPAAALLYFWGFVTFQWTVISLVLNWVLVSLLLMLYLYQMGQFNLRVDFSFLKAERLKRMGEYGFYGILGSLGSLVATKIDTVMLMTLSTLANTGIFTIALFISNVIDIPRTAIRRITGPLISEAWHKDNRTEIRRLYQRSSIILLIIDLYLFLGIWSCIDDLFSLMPNGEVYRAGKYVVLILGLSRLIDAVTSLNDTIIGYSRYFRFNFYAILALAVFNVVCNIFFIPRWEIIGAALATMASLFLYNVIKLLFIRLRFGWLPFTPATWYALLLGSFTYLVVWLIPETASPILNILIKGGIVSVLFLIPAYALKFSPELNEMADPYLDRIRHIFNAGKRSDK